MLNDSASVSFRADTGTDRILHKTDFAIADFPNAATRFIGSDGLIYTTEASAPSFDVRQYRQVELLFQMGGLSGGASPTVTLAVYYYDASDDTGRINNFNLGNANIGAAGGRGQALMGEGLPLPGASTTGTFSVHQYTYQPQRPLWLRINWTTAGSPTGLVAPTRLSLYGHRW